MPSEPAESNFKSKVRAHTYPCVERGGLVWTYMGPRETSPPLPDIEPNMLGSSVTAAGSYCNWLQKMENNLDTVHWSFLHAGAINPDSIEEPALKAWMNYGEELGENFPNMLRSQSGQILRQRDRVWGKFCRATTVY
jgi:phenylpropionate dioxygenase-like ring-hydroxylating dioxygenase large terminal subunit